MTEALINLTRPQFESLMEEQGLENATEGILLDATHQLQMQDNPITLESLKSGTHPILDRLDRYKGLEPDERQLGEEEILTIFTNVQDYGRYDPGSDTSGAVEAATSGAGRMIPESIGAYGGWKAGLTAATPIASLIPPIGWGLLGRGLVYAVGGVGGSILGAIGAGAIEDAVIGEADPVVPSLEPSYRGGETAMIALSMLATPWKLNPNIPKASTGSLEFLENFKTLSSGKYKDVADKGFETWATNAGFTTAQAAKLLDVANKARESATRGRMFGAAYGANLGFTRFNPAGYLTDPRKGPKAARLLAGIEGGVERSMQLAREKPLAFGILETVRAGGTGLGAATAQYIDPYGDVSRVAGELTGSLIVPLPVTLAAEYTPDVWNFLIRWWGKSKNTEGLLEDKLKKDGATRIMKALRASQEYIDEVEADGKVVLTADEKLSRFINELDEAAKKDLGTDKDGKPVVLSVADLADELGLDFGPTLKTIQDELAKTSVDLQSATDAGRASLRAGAENSISTLTATGDPLALAAAARIQQGLFEQNILDNMEGGVSKLVNAANKIVGGTGVQGASTRPELSKRLYDILEQNINQSKERERRFWKDVKYYPLTQFFSRNGREISQPNVLQLLDRSVNRGGLRLGSKGAQRDLNNAIGNYAADIEDLRLYFQQGEGRNPATSTRFFEMRSGIQNNARQLRQKGDLVNARRLDQISDALLRDLTGMRDNTSVAYNNARAYTFARNNVFTRSFLKSLDAYDAKGGLVLEPENLLKKAFEGGYNNVAKRFDQIKAAGRFLVHEAGYSEEAVRMMEADDIMTAALQDSLRQIVDRKVIKNPATGEAVETFVVNPTKLQNLKDKPGTQELFFMLPDLETDLANAQTAQNAFDNMLLVDTNKIKPSAMAMQGFDEEQLATLYGTKAFQWVVQTENPADAVTNALDAKHPTIALNALYKMVDNANPEDLAAKEFTKQQAFQGLTQAIFKHAWTKADSGASAAPNGNVLQSVLFRQIPGVNPSVKLSLRDWMVSKGLAVNTKEELEQRLAQKLPGGGSPLPVPVMDDVQEAVNRLRGVEEAFKTGNFENILFKNPSLGKLFYTRIVGATFGGWIQSKMKQLLGLPQMSGGLIAEQTGSELVQRVLLRGPESQRVKIMTDLFSNPKALSALLKDIKTKEDLDNSVEILAKFFAPMLRQGAVRAPIGIREAVEEDIEPVVEETIEEEPVVEETVVEEPVVEEPVPPPVSAVTPPTPVPATAPSPTNLLASAPLQPRPTIASAPQAPTDRARFAALFPFDSTSALIRQQSANQGIGSLVG